MKIAIIGSRECSNIDFAGNLETVLNVSKDDTIISGGAKGIDTLAANYAKENNLNLIEFLPDYKKNGRAATFIRNREIVDNSNVVVAFWNGNSKGTKYTLDYARKKEKRIIVVSI
ncbi:MAG: DUF2493 domain-containing protein [Prevotella pallens]|uniref:SLOG family protein n=1 Tax=Prevotella pallens TaxID=60133 RepID=UPI001CB210CD|nr:SLOG family protein [Prevotella pallens]MBF1491440.1 DUF2493 domain-containing protein [Prevotella pallens]